MRRDVARQMIAEILARIDEDDLPQPDKRDDYRHPEYGTCHWFGGHGYYLGATKLAGEPHPADHRRDGIEELFNQETMHRLETRFWEQIAEVSA